MTRHEVKQIMRLLKTAYPNFHKKDADWTAVVDLWAVGLAEYEVEFIMSGLKSLIATCKFPPTVSEVIQSAYDKSIDFLEVISLEQGFCEIRPDVWVDMGKNKKPVKYSEWTQRKGLKAGRMMIG